MNIKKLCIFLLLLPFLSSYGQGLHLDTGKKYWLSQSYTQNTNSEAGNIRGNVSLDIRSSVKIEVLGMIDTETYKIECQYEKLSLSMFSSDMDIAISSETRSSSLIMKYFSLLEEHKFKARLSTLGELTEIENLDDFINSFYEVSERNTNEQDIIIRTILEAFGDEALSGFFNLTLNVYCTDKQTKCAKEVAYSFNAKPMMLHNTFYSQTPRDGGRRIQGIGAIAANEEEFEYEGGNISTKISGNQTFDHLFEAQSGWLKKGNSKQKIYLISVFHNNKNLPEGLEIPSLTETEFEFKGGRINDEK